MSFLTDCAVLPDHIEITCNDYKHGGFPSFAIVNKDATCVGDWANSTKWLADITAGKVKVVNRVKVGIPKPNVTFIDNPVANGSVQIADTFEWKFEGIDANKSTLNDSFYTTLNNKEAYLVLWNDAEAEIVVIDKKTTFVVTPVYPSTNKEIQMYDIQANWTSSVDYFPTSYTAPTGVFSTGS